MSSQYYEVLSTGTHDIMNATATGNTEEFVVLTAYFEHSNALGALFNFAYYNDKGDLSFHLLPLNRSDSMQYNLPKFSLYKSIFRISVYDIESDGLLFTNGDDVHVSYPAVIIEETGTEQCMNNFKLVLIIIMYFFLYSINDNNTGRHFMFTFLRYNLYFDQDYLH